MYAIIRAGGKQAKVRPGDVIDIERVKHAPDELEFTPLLVVDDKGNVVSDRSALAGIKVKAKTLGEVKGEKLDIFKYRNKSGYRRRQGHRQLYTSIEVTSIDVPSKAKKAPSKAETGDEAQSSQAETAEKAQSSKTKTAEDQSSKPAATKKAQSSKAGSTKKTPSSKPAAKKTPSSKAAPTDDQTEES